MEFKQIQVKVTTLNKSLFQQLETLDKNDFRNSDQSLYMPELIGWINHEGLWFIINHNGKLARVTQVTISDIWLVHNQNKIKDMPYSTFWKNFKVNVIDKLEQIFL